MANIKSAEKRIRQIAKRTATNKDRMSRIKTYIRKVEEAIESGDKEQANQAFKQVMPELHRGAARGILHARNASRRISRISKRIKALG